MGAEFLAVSCPGCGTRSDKVPARLAGRSVRCPRCSRTFTVPVPSEPAPTVFAPPAPLPTALAEAGPVPAPEPRPLRPSAAPTAVRLTTESRAVEWKTGEVVLGLYEVAGELGRGGMGRVYKVRHRGWGLDLAAKVPLSAVLEIEGGAELFEREAETWVNLGLHPHTVTCHYVRPVEGVPVVFAEFVDGGSLHRWIRERRLATVDTILDVAIQFAWGLHYAHEQGLVHLDVKPANVMLTAEGLAKVTDFGLARARTAAGPAVGVAAGGGEGGQTMTVDGAAGGTPAYVSPEQADGLTVTRRSDLWSWALSVLEMFQGVRSWEYGRAATEVLEAYLEAEPPPGLPAMPAVVADLLRRCFRREPEERPRTLKEAADVLRTAHETAAGRPYPRRAPRAGRGTPDSLNNRAVSLLDLGREAEAAGHWRRAVEAQPHHIEATYNQAVAGWIGGRWDDEEMLRRVGEARTTHAASPRIHHLLGRLHHALGDPLRAIQSLEEAVRLGPPDVEIDRDLGLAALSASPTDPALTHRATECFARTVQAGSQEAVDLAGYALSLERAGEREKAQHFYTLAVAQKGDLPSDLASALRVFLPGQQTVASFKGLTAPVAAMATTPDGALVLAGSGREVRIWDAHGVPVRTLRAEEGGPVRCLAVTPDSRFLLWASEGMPVQVWDLFSGRPVRSWQRQTGHATALVVAPDGQRALAGGSDRLVRLWNLETGQCLRTLEGHEDAVTAVAAGRTRAVSGDRGGSVRVWDLEGGRSLGLLRGHEGPVAAVALCEEDARVVTAGEDRTVRDWGLNSHELVRAYLGHIQPVTSLALGREGLLFTGSLDRTVRAWRLDRERMLSLVRLDAAVLGLLLGPDGTLCAAHGSAVSALRLVERPRLPAFALAPPVSAVEVEQQVATFESRIEEARRALGQGDPARALELTRTARTIPGYERAEPALALWDEICSQLPRKGLQSAWEESRLEGHTDQVLCVAVSPDGGHAVSAGMDVPLRLWDLRQRRALAALTGHQGTVTSAAFTRDGRRIVSGSWDRTVRVWDPAAGRLIRTLTGHEEYVSGVDVAPDATRAVSGSWDHTVRLWPLGPGAAPAVLAGHASNVAAVAFSPDGRYVVSGAWDATVRAWDAANGECVCVFEGHEGNVSAVAVSPSGRQVASGGIDTSVRVWDPRTRRSVQVLSGHTAEVTGLVFCPDGRYLASASRDETVRVWDLQKGTCERSLPHAAPVLCLALTPLGNALLTGGGDRTLRSWHLDWEPEPARPAAWDEKARPFLETFVSLRLKPETVRAASAGASLSDADVDALLTDLRRRGFGNIRREAVLGKLKHLTAPEVAPPSFWDEVRKSGPKVALRAVPAAREIPWGRLVLRFGLAALAVLGIVVGVRSWMQPAHELRLVPYMVKTVAKEVDLIDLASFSDPCDGGYETWRDLARAPEVSGPALMCLARFKDGGTVTDFLAEAPLADPVDARRTLRLLRNAVSLMVGLGDAAVEPLCGRLGDSRPEVRRVAAVSLAKMGSPTATACLRASLAQDYPLVRTSAASAVRTLLAHAQVEPSDGWALVRSLLRDPEPAVRIEALRALVMFTPELAALEASPLASDPEPSVARAAKEALANIEAVRKIDKLRAGS